jgi:hypothetical protein
MVAAQGGDYGGAIAALDERLDKLITEVAALTAEIATLKND